MGINLKEIKLIVSDFDGVMTNNLVLVDEIGKESVFCNRGDGLGIELLKKNTNIVFMVLSKEKNRVVNARCNKLDIKCIQGIDNKKELLLKEIKKKGIKPKNVCFIGNDINDLECMEMVGIGIAVADSNKELLKTADFITKKKGGMGAVREIIDKILYG